MNAMRMYILYNKRTQLQKTSLLKITNRLQGKFYHIKFIFYWFYKTKLIDGYTSFEFQTRNYIVNYIN